VRGDAIRRANVNGTNLAYELTGEGPVVVLLHGFGLDLRMWDDQMAALRRRFRVLRFDTRGFGRSDLPEPGVPFSANDDLRALLRHLEIPRVHLIGLSMGGHLALNFAVENPELVERLVLVDSSLAGFEWSPEFLQRMDQIDEVAQTEGVGAAQKQWLLDPLFATARENPEIARRLTAMVGDYSGWHWLHGSVAKGPDPPAIRRLASVRNPTLVLVGEKDLADFQRIARILLDGIPGSLGEVVPHVGHMSNMESPGEFNERVLRFL
jgi:3-oxoadipate enol-lactonase